MEEMVIFTETDTLTEKELENIRPEDDDEVISNAIVHTDKWGRTSLFIPSDK